MRWRQQNESESAKTDTFLANIIVIRETVFLSAAAEEPLKVFDKIYTYTIQFNISICFVSFYSKRKMLLAAKKNKLCNNLHSEHDSRNRVILFINVNNIMFCILHLDRIYIFKKKTYKWWSNVANYNVWFDHKSNNYVNKLFHRINFL